MGYQIKGNFILFFIFLIIPHFHTLQYCLSKQGPKSDEVNHQETTLILRFFNVQLLWFFSFQILSFIVNASKNTDFTLVYQELADVVQCPINLWSIYSLWTLLDDIVQMNLENHNALFQFRFVITDGPSRRIRTKNDIPSSSNFKTKELNRWLTS